MYLFDKNGNEVQIGDWVYVYEYSYNPSNHRQIGKIISYEYDYELRNRNYRGMVMLHIELINTSGLTKRSLYDVVRMKDEEVMLIKLESEGYDRQKW